MNYPSLDPYMLPVSWWAYLWTYPWHLRSAISSELSGPGTGITQKVVKSTGIRSPKWPNKIRLRIYNKLPRYIQPFQGTENSCWLLRLFFFRFGVDDWHGFSFSRFGGICYSFLGGCVFIHIVTSIYSREGQMTQLAKGAVCGCCCCNLEIE